VNGTRFDPAKVRAIRKARGLSQNRLAGEVRCTREAIRQIEARISRPSVGLLERLASALEVPVAEFFR
jgi:transcriptional regulator with XRE-family HTH domain